MTRTGHTRHNISESQKRTDRIEPLSVVMVLALAGITMLFAGLSAALLYNAFTSGFEVQFPPIVFFVTIVILFVATVFMRRAKAGYIKGDVTSTRGNSLYCLAFTILFAAVQAYGWIEFFAAQNDLQDSNFMGYAFALSALHLLHVLAGIPFLIHFMMRLRKNMRTGASLPAVKHVNALSLYWDFLDILWIGLVALLVAVAVLG